MRDVRCPACKRLLCRIDAPGTKIEVKCGNRVCGRILEIGPDGLPREQVLPAAPLTRAS